MIHTAVTLKTPTTDANGVAGTFSRPAIVLEVYKAAEGHKPKLRLVSSNTDSDYPVATQYTEVAHESEAGEGAPCWTELDGVAAVQSD